MLCHLFFHNFFSSHLNAYYPVLSITKLQTRNIMLPFFHSPIIDNINAAAQFLNKSSIVVSFLFKMSSDLFSAISKNFHHSTEKGKLGNETNVGKITKYEQGLGFISQIFLKLDISVVLIIEKKCIISHSTKY